MSGDAKKCPRCGLVNTVSAESCDCGYTFSSDEPPSPAAHRRYWPPAFADAVGPTLFGLAVVVGLFVVLAITMRNYDWLMGPLLVGVLALLAAPFALKRVISASLRKWLKAASWGALVFAILFFLMIPDLFRSRVSANESSTIGNLRTLSSAQAAYAKLATGYAPTAACLFRPANCISNYNGPAFLDESHLGWLQTVDGRYVVSGYVYEMHPGPLAGSAGVAPGSISAFAYVAVPADPGKSGMRGFCADITGLVCFSYHGEPPPVRDGACQVESGLCNVLIAPGE